MERTRAERRHNDITKALRKRQLAKEIYFEGNIKPYYNNLHQYSKNKIHCSCPICTSKTKRKDYYMHGGRWNGYNWKHSDLIKQMRLNYELDDYYGGWENDSVCSFEDPYQG